MPIGEKMNEHIEIRRIQKLQTAPEKEGGE
jgi:hypothetical protein